MVNQQKGVQQETAYSAVVVTVPAYIIFSCFYDPFWVENDIGTGIHTIIQYRQFLVALLFADLPSLSPFIS